MTGPTDSQMLSRVLQALHRLTSSTSAPEIRAAVEKALYPAEPTGAAIVWIDPYDKTSPAGLGRAYTLCRAPGLDVGDLARWYDNVQGRWLTWPDVCDLGVVHVTHGPESF